VRIPRQGTTGDTVDPTTESLNVAHGQRELRPASFRRDTAPAMIVA
jgi:hypothetical protein